METVISFLVGAVLSGLLIYTVVKPKLEKKKEDIERENEKLTEKAKSEAKEVVLEAKGQAVETRNEAMKVLDKAKTEEGEARKRWEKVEERLVKKEQSLDSKLENVEKKNEESKKINEEAQKNEEKAKTILENQLQELEKVAGMKKEEAKEVLLEKVEKETQEDIVNRMRNLEAAAKEEADKKARNIIVHSIQKYAAEVASESTATIVDLPSDEMKGRIIGREGRNINAFEQATGIDVIVDDTPGSVVISGFDLLRRYVAKAALEKLIADGRIHPAKIEEVLDKTKKEAAQLVKEFGEKAVFQVGITGLHPNLVKLIGRLRFRTSYGQNVLKHSLEVAFIAAAIAGELGADIQIAKKAGFLHDIGKAVDHEIEGNHALIGRDIAKKFNLSEAVIHAIAAHHEDEEPQTAEAFIIQAADAISSARPGARKESLAAYIKRLQSLEQTANSFEGVKKSFAIQAGREVRVFVEPEDIDDLQAIRMAKDIANKVETELEYPGQIKVNVIRETRSVEYAK